MTSRRNTRVSEVVRKQLNDLLIRTPDLEGKLITISALEITPNLKQAFVFFSTIDPKANRESLMVLLEGHRLEWQAVIGKKLKTKYTPHLTFRFDDSVERGDRVMEIMRQIEEADTLRNKDGKPGTS